MRVTIEIYAICLAWKRKILFICLFKSSRKLLSSDFSCLTLLTSFASRFDLLNHIWPVELSTEFMMDSCSICMQHCFMFFDN
jgi:hypothetical protein